MSVNVDTASAAVQKRVSVAAALKDMIGVRAAPVAFSARQASKTALKVQKEPVIAQPMRASDSCIIFRPPLAWNDPWR